VISTLVCAYTNFHIRKYPITLISYLGFNRDPLRSRCELERVVGLLGAAGTGGDGADYADHSVAG
jgi:hypothetical protein